MISAYFHGEMGNNMFQFAAALGHAQKLNVETEFSYWRNYKASITDYPLELPTMFDYTFNFKENSVHPFEMYLHPDLEKTFEYTDIPMRDNLLMRGYFQSEKYFENIKDDLKNIYFKPHPSVIKSLEEKWLGKHDFSNSLSIHLRIGHDRNLKGDRPDIEGLFPVCPVSYYVEAINKVIEMDDNISNIICFSDDIEWCKENMASDEMIFIEGNTPVEDMFLMSMCKHNITGNSTFSWWSAYLNSNPDKIVIVPETLWFGPQLSYLNKKDLFLPDWIKI